MDNPETEHYRRIGDLCVCANLRKASRAITGLELPAVEKISESQQEQPFQVLIATLLSARTQDATTHAASTRLFAAASTPDAMAALPVRRIEALIKPVSFFRTKARHVKATCRMLVERFGGVVPEIASRAHVERILPVIDEALRRAETKPAELAAVAVANTPGLAGSLLVGLVFRLVGLLSPSRVAQR